MGQVKFSPSTAIHIFTGLPNDTATLERRTTTPAAIRKASPDSYRPEGGEKSH